MGMTIRHDGITAEWLGYATLRLAGDDTVVYLDPGRYGVLTGEWEPDTANSGHPPAREGAPRHRDVVWITPVHHPDPAGTHVEDALASAAATSDAKTGPGHTP